MNHFSQNRYFNQNNKIQAKPGNLGIPRSIALITMAHTTAIITAKLNTKTRIGLNIIVLDILQTYQTSIHHYSRHIMKITHLYCSDHITIVFLQFYKVEFLGLFQATKAP